MARTRIDYGLIPTKDFGNPNKESLRHVSSCASQGAGQVALLYKYLEKVLGKKPKTRDQGSGSDCTGQSTARGIDVLQGVRIGGLGLAEKFTAYASASAIYGGARYEVGYKRYRYFNRKNGAHVPYAAEFVRDFGTLFQIAYPQIDLSVHRWAVSKLWGRTGVPDELEPLARLHCVKAFIPINSYEEYRGAIVNGFPVIIGSKFGFAGQRSRDDEGFLKPNGEWNHAMVGTAVDDEYKRPGGLIENSWGPNWVRGPKRHDQPDGSFWVDADVIDAMTRRGEAIALSGFDGFPSQILTDYSLID